MNLLKWVRSGRLDRLGIILSSICFVHCIGSALLLILPLAAGGSSLNPESEFHFYITSAVALVAVVTFLFGLTLHRHWPTAAVGLLACVVISFAAFSHNLWEVSHLTHFLIFVAGSLVLIFAHWKNMRLCRCHSHH